MGFLLRATPLRFPLRNLVAAHETGLDMLICSKVRAGNSKW